MKRLLRSERGSVSVMLIIILTILVLFNAVLIDFARIKIAERQTETALRTALKSALSHYDNQLLDAYGLFAIRHFAEGEDTFQKVLYHHMSDLSDSGSFSFISPQWVPSAIQLKSQHALTNPHVFKRQVLEQMKYKAPIEFSLMIWDKLHNSGLTDELSETSSTVAISEQLERQLLKREQLLDQAWQQVKAYFSPNGEIAAMHAKYASRFDEINRLSDEVTSLDSLLVQEQSLEQEQPSEEETDAEQHEQDRLKKLAELTKLIVLNELSLQVDATGLQQLQQRVSGILAEASEINEQLAQSEAEYEQAYSYDRTYFTAIEVGISKVISVFNGFKLRFNRDELFIDEASYAENDAVKQTANKFYQEQRLIEEKRMADNEQLEQLKGEKIDSIEEQLMKVQGLLSACDADELSYPESLLGVDAEQVAAEFAMDPGQASQVGSMSLKWVDQLRMSLLGARDKAYLNEYALHSFNHRTNPNSNGLPNQEVEYLLYGFGSCVLNHGAAFAEMYAFRLAIRTMEALLKPGRKIIGIASPWLVILYAVAEGAVKAYDDLKKLVEGKEVELSASLSNRITLNYEDYLRIFLFLHGNEASLIARMQALISWNLGIDPNEKSTYIQGTASATIRLWFIPEMMKLLDQNVSGRQVIIEKTMDASY